MVSNYSMPQLYFVDSNPGISFDVDSYYSFHFVLGHNTQDTI